MKWTGEGSACWTVSTCVSLLRCFLPGCLALGWRLVLCLGNRYTWLVQHPCQQNPLFFSLHQWTVSRLVTCAMLYQKHPCFCFCLVGRFSVAVYKVMFLLTITMMHCITGMSFIVDVRFILHVRRIFLHRTNIYCSCFVIVFQGTSEVWCVCCHRLT